MSHVETNQVRQIKTAKKNRVGRQKQDCKKKKIIANKQPNKKSPITPPVASVPWVLNTLKAVYPNARCALEHKNAFELLVATILSAQTTDKSVNKLTPQLFASYPTPQALARAPLLKLEKQLASINYFRSKARHLKSMAQKLVKDFHGQVPQQLEDLVLLPGVGRKTANVVLGNAFGIASGIVVDTHVQRLSQRLGWTQQHTPQKIEQDLMQIIPKEDWIIVSHLLIEHGRTQCKAQKPLCATCPLNAECPQWI